MTVTLHHADMLSWLAAYDGPLFDSCVTDPPYHLTSIVKRFGGDKAAPARTGKSDNATGAYARVSKGFMGKTWDGGDIAFRPETWRAVYDALKPGAHLVAFSGTRTYHRMACAIEDAGFEIRDCLFWAYGSGFPKSHDVSKGIDRHNGDVREKVKVSSDAPAYQRGIGNHRPWMDNPDHERDGPTAASAASAAWQGWGTALKPALEPICLARKPLSEKSVAANVLRHGTGAINIDACRVAHDEQCRMMAAPQANIDNPSEKHRQAGRRSAVLELKPQGRWPANLVHDGSDEVVAGFPDTTSGTFSGHRNQPKTNGIYGAFDLQDERGHVGDSGSAARFFYSAKAGPLDRIGTAHATVKPVDLMRWLVRLVTPPGGHILEPFAGSGTTGIAAMAEGFACTMLELEAEHVADIERKLAFLRGDGGLRTIEQHKAKRDRAKDAGAGPLFGEVA